MVELYRNALVDLLNKAGGDKDAKPLNVRQDKTGAVYIENLIERECTTAEELSKVMDDGMNQRTVAATAMNSESSRSHLILMVKLVSVNKETKAQLKGKILFVDLAGSERREDTRDHR